ncbi:preprotein translocase subunit SecG [Candidatus Annandia adelgestsuga]|uniref:preprotein translocase subunit SecG n=1 Tax=Candidatus Annandia adelgestsuga TaxID=1302411 RepID=UPI000F7F4B5D
MYIIIFVIFMIISLILIFLILIQQNKKFYLYNNFNNTKIFSNIINKNFIKYLTIIITIIFIIINIIIIKINNNY